MNLSSLLLTVREIDFAVKNAGPFDDDFLSAHCGDLWAAKLVRFLEPTLIVELGTGDGVTAAQLLAALPRGGELHTVNWPNPPSGDDVGRYLREYVGSTSWTRLFQEAGWSREQFLMHYTAEHVKTATQHYADTTEPRVAASVPDGVELLWIDSTHELEHVRREWALWAPKLCDGAVVVLDDVHFAGGRVEEFWDALPYDKLDGVGWGGMGMFRYDRSKEVRP